jgi:cephalosporin-C deacetylase-like acetyl esterase
MSASDHIQPKLFHGTHHYFSEGDTINPSSDVHFYEHYTKDKTPRVYLTSSFDEAKGYAEHRVSGQQKLFGPIYEVDAPDATSVASALEKFPHLAPYADAYKTTYTSTSTNLVPKKIAGWAINPNITE